MLVLAGCAGDGDAGATDDVSAATSTTQQDTATPTPSPSRAPSPSPTASPTRKSSPAEARSVRDDVETVAVSLESFYRGGEYPRDLAAVKATLSDAGLELSPGNRLGSYVYDADRVEFTLCVEGKAGAWAAYNTAPMTIQESGASGGCP